MLKMIAFLLFLLSICVAAFAFKDPYNEKVVHYDHPFSRPFILSVMPQDLVFDPWEDVCEAMIARCDNIYRCCGKDKK